MAAAENQLNNSLDLAGNIISGPQLETPLEELQSILEELITGEPHYQYSMMGDPGPLPEKVASTFSGGKYNERTLKEDVVLYRAGDSNGNPLGRYFTSNAPTSVAQVRIDLAVKEQWIDPSTGALTGTSVIDSYYAIKIPAGTKIYVGPAAYQGGIYLGGAEQIFIDEPWNINGVEVISNVPLP